MLNKILVAIDNSTRGRSVFNTAISLAKTMDASLMLLHVLSEEDPDYPVLPTYAYYSVLKGIDSNMLQEKFAEYEENEIKFLQNLTQKAIDQGIRAECIQLSGIPGWEICELANTWSADLIVVGSRGLRGLKEMFLGSVSNYVTHHSPCSVFIVRTEDDLKNSSTDLYSEAEADPKAEFEVLQKQKSTVKY